VPRVGIGPRIERGEGLADDRWVVDAGGGRDPPLREACGGRSRVAIMIRGAPLRGCASASQVDRGGGAVLGVARSDPGLGGMTVAGMSRERRLVCGAVFPRRSPRSSARAPFRLRTIDAMRAHGGSILTDRV
jgi:hypothetical protein